MESSWFISSITNFHFLPYNKINANNNAKPGWPETISSITQIQPISLLIINSKRMPGFYTGRLRLESAEVINETVFFSNQVQDFTFLVHEHECTRFRFDFFQVCLVESCIDPITIFWIIFI